MAKESDHLAGTLGSEKTGGVLSGLLAEENEFDRRTLWRLGSWGLAAVAAVIVAVLANQSSLGWRREQVAAADLAHQAQQLKALARESDSERRRLASAIDTLNGDRDRLFSRVTVLEQGLDSVTGALARQKSAAAPAPPAPPASTKAPAAGEPAALSQAAAVPPPAVAPVATTVASSTERPAAETPVPAQARATRPALAQDQPRTEQAKEQLKDQPNQTKAMDQASSQAAPPDSSPAAATSPLPKIASDTPPAASILSLSPPNPLMGPPDPAASKLMEPAKTPTGEAPPAGAEAAATAMPESEGETGEGAAAKVERTEFAVDLGFANSVGGLRALWRGLVKSNAELATLSPIIVVKERNNGLGMQLRLAAGPLMDAAAAAKICAALIENHRACETTLFDGQRLALQNEEKDRERPASSPASKSRSERRHSVQRHPKQEDPPKPEPSALYSLFGRR